MLPSESNAGNAIVSTDTPNPPSPTADERAADVAARVNQAWDRIEAFASRKHPPLLASLRPGVDPTLLAKFEATFGLRFPAGLRASLLRHDGQEHLVAGKPSLPLLWLFGAYRLNNLASMAETAEEWLKPSNRSKFQSLLSQLIPIASSHLDFRLRLLSWFRMHLR
jgi:hypothetical protein